MFNKATNMNELLNMKQKKIKKVVDNKKNLSSREISYKRQIINQDFSARAQAIVTASVPIQQDNM